MIDRTVVCFYDETSLQENEENLTLWAENRTAVMRPKSKGSGTMVSDFISEQEEYNEVKKADQTIRNRARQKEYGKGKQWILDMR